MNLARRDSARPGHGPPDPDPLHDHRPVPDRPGPDQRDQDQEGDLRLTAGAADARDLHPGRLPDRAGAGRLHALLRQQPDRHRRLPGADPDLRRHGRVRAGRVPLPRQHAARPVPGAGHHDPDPPGHRGHPRADGPAEPGQHADRADLGLHRTGTAAGDLHPLGIHAQRVQGPQGRGPDRRPVRVHDLLPHRPAADAPAHGDRGRVHHDPGLERSLVPADPGARARPPRPSRWGRRCSWASSSPTGTPCSPPSRSRSSRSCCST